ncbi:MAG: polysaccharide deacetylase family protein [Rhizomicrobium sp.]
MAEAGLSLPSPFVPAPQPEGLLARAVVSARTRAVRSLKLRALRSHLGEPLVSFSFDDFPRSALTVGGEILRNAGWTGTYYVAGSICGRRIAGIDYFDREDLIRAEREGHEIGCHTFSHFRLGSVASSVILADLERNADFVRSLLPQRRLSSFAYPFGDVGLRAKVLMARQFPVCRGIWAGLNRGRMDFAQLRSVGIERRSLDESAIESWLDRAVASKAWLIFFMHDISDNPTPFGCPRDVFARIVASVARRRIKVLPVKNAAGLAAASFRTA